MILWCGAVLGSSTTRARDVVIVLSSDAAPYVQAEAGFKSAFAADAPSFHEVFLNQLRDTGIDANIAPDPGVVVAIGTPAAVFLHAHLPPSAPLLFCMVANPQGAGLNLHLSGITTDVPIDAQFSLIARAIPSAHSLGILYRSDTASGQRLIQRVRAQLPKDWTIEAVAADKYSSISDAINDLLTRRIDVVWTSLDAGVYDAPTARALLLAALRARVPVFGFSPAFVRAGALIGIGIDPAAQGRQAADLARSILSHSVNPSAGQIQPPGQFQIAVNKIVADKIGIQLPQDLLDQAAFVSGED
jgi:putative ABC transport system substrate-binding protein